jgi:hypothetical protein
MDSGNSGNLGNSGNMQWQYGFEEHMLKIYRPMSLDPVRLKHL